MIHRFFKKTLICLMVVFLLLTSSIDIFSSSKAHANFVTKPIEITAKKTLKDLAEHVAVGMAEQIVQNYLIDEFIESAVTKVDAGFAPVCLDKKVKDLKDCPPEKIAQVKRDFTAADKNQLRGALEGVIAQKTYTSYKWQQFLDFFIPVFLTNGLVAFFDSLLDPESEGLINEVAQEALIKAGLLKPIVHIDEIGTEMYDFEQVIHGLNFNIWQDYYTTYIEMQATLKPNAKVNMSYYSTYNSLSPEIREKTYRDNMSFKLAINTMSKSGPRIDNETYYYGQVETHRIVEGNYGYNFVTPSVLFLDDNYYLHMDANWIGANWAKDNLYTPLLEGTINDRMNKFISIINTTDANMTFDISQISPKPVETDYGKQTGTEKIKDTDGKVKIRGIDSYKFTYQNKDVYPSDKSSTGWKVRKTGEDIAVGEDVSVKDKDEKEPEEPTEPSNPSCNESDDMEVDSGQCEGVPYFGSKLEFIFGNATGNKNHIERSLAMELQLNSIGIFDDAKGKKLVLDNLSNAFDDPSSIVKTLDNGRVVRTSILTGPNDKLKVESVWNKEKLISVQLGEDVGEEPDDGTVWKYINITQPFYDGTKIPKSFELEADGEKFWVHPNGTKHMVEYITRDATTHGMPINSQTLLTSFHNSVNGAVKEGIKYEEIMNIGNWELIFSKPREEGLLPVIKHAVYMP
ncbi:hypothetical protein ABFY60_15420 [Lysinibacillus pakistanensis]|uniref:hypothetical protein n=1 Tax=Lysinibacillus pakistanensis TaxID=759811 RepID=UPI003D2CD9C1